MRPLLVDLGRDYRGGQNQALLLLQGLLARGHAPELLTIDDSLLARRAQSAGARVHLVKRRWRQLGASLAIRNLLSRHGLDIVHANEPHALTAAWLARAHRRAPLIASRRVIFPLARGAVSLARYRAAVRIVAVSQCVASAVAASGIPPSQIAVIPDGVPIPPVASAAEREAARQSLGIDLSVPLVGCVAALTPDKGQETLIRALPGILARIPGCQLLLAGDGPCRAKLAAVANELGMEGSVRFEGFLEDLGGIYAAIDLFAFPAQAEALGTALLSAMAHRLPVVALARGGIPEVIQDGENGLLLKDTDPQALAGALAGTIVRILTRPDESNRLAASARETAMARFSADRMVEETIRLYEKVVDRS